VVYPKKIDTAEAWCAGRARPRPTGHRQSWRLSKQCGPHWIATGSRLTWGSRTDKAAIARRIAGGSRYHSA